MMPPHADDYLHPTQLVSIRVHERSEILACTGGTTVYRSDRGQPLHSLACLPRRVRQSSGLPPLPLVPRVTFVLPPTAPGVKCVFLGVAT